MQRDMPEIGEYLYWLGAIACYEWLSGRKREATIIAEAIRRIIDRTHLNNRVSLSEFPRLYGLRDIMAALASINKKTLGEAIFGRYPWSLIFDHGSGQYTVRLILERCDECFTELCPCLSPEDCDKVLIQKEVSGDINKAIDTLAQLYLSYFFSEKAIKDGICPRVEIDDEYWSIMNELRNRGLLLEIKVDKKKLQEIRKRREEKVKKIHEELIKSTIDYYEKEFPNDVEKLKLKFQKEVEKVDWSMETLMSFIGSLDLAYTMLNGLREKARERGQEYYTIARRCLDLLEKAIKALFPNWVRGDALPLPILLKKDSVELALDKLNETLDCILKNRVKLAIVDIRPKAIREYADSLQYITFDIIKAIIGLENYLNYIDSLANSIP